MPAPKKPQQPIGVTGGPRLEERLKERGIQVRIAWAPTEGQARAIIRHEDEVFMAGSKGGGKSDAGIAWMVKGNSSLPDFDKDGKPILVNQSYVYHPKFLGAVIRLNEKDLAEWVDRAIPLYCGLLGADYTKNPSEFRWVKSGARIFVGHMKDQDAYTKYQGQNIVRFLIEEAGQIPSLERFDEIRSCCRSIYPEMKAQIFLTANPGGPGTGWLFDRYLEPKDRDGKPIKHPKENRPILYTDKGMIPIVEAVENPFTHQMIQTTRVWVPSFLTDNPHIANNQQYIAALATITDEKKRRAYLFGDWLALSGNYFDLFRKDTHTYEPMSRPLASWWRATGSLDWGFVHESAAYKHKQDPETKQHLVYEEYVTSRTDPVELGEALARWWMPELRIQGSVILHVSHDLFHNKIGEFTWADLISKGVQRVLGKDMCYLPDQLIKQLKEQYQLEGKEWSEEMEQRILAKPITGLVLRRAPSARAVGFMYLRSLMRVESKIPQSTERPNMEVATRILNEGTAEQYVAYLQSFNPQTEILPQMLISQACTRLIDAIPKGQHDDKNPEDLAAEHFVGMDSLDSLRYLMGGIRDAKPTAMPIELERERRIQQARQRNPTMSVMELCYLNDSISDELKAQQGTDEAFCLGRNARASRRMEIVQ
jgi:hypothetical protein